MKLKISPCLWFDTEAEEAAQFYTGIFKDSRITAISRYPDAGQEIHGKPAGSVLTVAFELAGQPFTALNGGPNFKFNEAVSMEVECETQEEVDLLLGLGSLRFGHTEVPADRAAEMLLNLGVTRNCLLPAGGGILVDGVTGSPRIRTQPCFSIRRISSRLFIK